MVTNKKKISIFLALPDLINSDSAVGGSPPWGPEAAILFRNRYDSAFWDGIHQGLYTVYSLRIIRRFSSDYTQTVHYAVLDVVLVDVTPVMLCNNTALRKAGDNLWILQVYSEWFLGWSADFPRVQFWWIPSLGIVVLHNGRPLVPHEFSLHVGGSYPQVAPDQTPGI